MNRKIFAVLAAIASLLVLGCHIPTANSPTNGIGPSDLATIMLSAGTLVPPFASGTTAYKVQVSNSVTSIKLTGVQAHGTAKVSAPETLELEVEIPKTATIIVTSSTGENKAYTITVTRDKADSSNSNLRGIVLSTGSLSIPFSSLTTDYTAGIAYGEASVVITGEVADLEATVSEPVTLSNFTVGTPQTATLVVTAKDTSTKTYTVEVTMKENVKIELIAASLTSPEKLESGKAATNAISEIPADDEKPVTVVEQDPDDPKVRYRVTTQKKTASATYDQNNILKPDTDVIYPGSVLLGQSIDDGSYLEVTSGVKRHVNISYSLAGITDGIVGKSIIPSLFETRALHNEIMAQEIPGQASNQFQFEATEVNTEEALDLKISAGVSYSGLVSASVKAGFNYSKSNSTNKFLVRFSQTFYTVDLDQAGDKFLYESFDLSAFKGYRPVYVSSVAYGRVGFLSVETTLDKKTFETTLALAISYGSVEGETDVSLAKTKLTETSTIKINLIGGTSTPTSMEEFFNEIRDGVFSDNNRGVIIAYKLRFVDDNSIANTKFTGDYTARQVVAYTGVYTVTLTPFAIDANVADAGGNMELYGKLWSKQGINGPESILWERSSDNYLDAPKSGYSAISGNSVTYKDLISEDDTFVVMMRDFGEADTGADDMMNYGETTISIKQLRDGIAGNPQYYFRVRGVFTDYPSEYVDFCIAPTVVFDFNE